jgi:D-ribose pyranose/furanose isomerase RbsD
VYLSDDDDEDNHHHDGGNGSGGEKEPRVYMGDNFLSETRGACEALFRLLDHIELTESVVVGDVTVPMPDTKSFFDYCLISVPWFIKRMGELLETEIEALLFAKEECIDDEPEHADDLAIQASEYEDVVRNFLESARRFKVEAELTRRRVLGKGNQNTPVDALINTLMSNLTRSEIDAMKEKYRLLTPNLRYYVERLEELIQ